MVAAVAAYHRSNVAHLSWASAVRRNYGCWPPVAKTPAFV